MPAVRITSSWPTAMIPKIATWRARLARLSAVRNSSEASVMRAEQDEQDDQAAGVAAEDVAEA